MSFSSLGLAAPLLRSVAERSYTEPTPIQAEAIPAILRGGDVWASAQTGSGKTAAFALPLLQKLSESPRERGRIARVLVLVPTRELAAQVGAAFTNLGRPLTHPGIKVLVAHGGVSINPQLLALGGGTDVLVATPGRLLDLVAHNAVSLASVATVVLDEADRLFALGFAEELSRVLALLPARRQTLFFSATFPPAVWQLAESLLREPVRIAIPRGPETLPDITQRAIEVDVPQRTQLLRHLIEHEGWTRVLVFVATKYATEHVAEKLRRAGLDAGALHGELSQGARTEALENFKASRLRVLVATDVAARGLDIAHLPVVVNYDLPRSPEDYQHRIGRTGRAGESGLAVSFVSAETHAHFCLIEKRNRLTIAREQIAGFEPLETHVPAPPATGGIKGKRKSKKDKLREAAARAGGRPGGPRPSAPMPAKAPAAAEPVSPAAANSAEQSAPAAPAELFPYTPPMQRPRR